MLILSDEGYISLNKYVRRYTQAKNNLLFLKRQYHDAYPSSSLIMEILKTISTSVFYISSASMKMITLMRIYGPPPPILPCS